MKKDDDVKGSRRIFFCLLAHALMCKHARIRKINKVEVLSCMKILLCVTIFLCMMEGDEGRREKQRSSSMGERVAKEREGLYAMENFIVA